MVTREILKSKHMVKGSPLAVQNVRINPTCRANKSAIKEAVPTTLLSDASLFANC